MKKDARWGKRFRTNLTVRYGLDNLGESGVIQDISLFGFFVMTPQTYPNQTVVKFQILTPGKEYINLEGIVQWSVRERDDIQWLIKDQGMGIKIKRFLAGQEHYEKICQLLCQRRAMKEQNSAGAKNKTAATWKAGLLGGLFR
ncbi:MAG: PilZ domain-containing protein [Deltaproteobacteria bacterium]|nr:PilZ domain-containing protein [Deltaproteobacteria bacterium]